MKQPLVLMTTLHDVVFCMTVSQIVDATIAGHGIGAMWWIITALGATVAMTSRETLGRIHAMEQCVRHIVIDWALECMDSGHSAVDGEDAP